MTSRIPTVPRKPEGCRASISVSLKPFDWAPAAGLELGMNRSISVSLTSVGSKAPSALSILPRAITFSVPAPFNRGCARSIQAWISSTLSGIGGRSLDLDGSAAVARPGRTPMHSNSPMRTNHDRLRMGHTPFMMADDTSLQETETCCAITRYGQSVGKSESERNLAAARLFRTSSRLRQEGIDETRRAFLIVGREKIESSPEFVPQRHTIQDHPAHHLSALANMFLRGPGFIVGIGDDPEAEIAFAVIDLVDHFDHAPIGAGHEFRPRGERDSRDAVKQNLDLTTDI